MCAEPEETAIKVGIIKAPEAIGGTLVVTGPVNEAGHRGGQNGSFAVTKKIAAHHEQTPVDITQSHDETSLVTSGGMAYLAGVEPATF